MFDIQLAPLTFGDAMDSRNHFHETALHEARIATEHHATERQAPVPMVAPIRGTFIGRLRLAFASGPSTTTDACNCPA